MFGRRETSSVLAESSREGLDPPKSFQRSQGFTAATVVDCVYVLTQTVEADEGFGDLPGQCLLQLMSDGCFKRAT